MRRFNSLSFRRFVPALLSVLWFGGVIAGMTWLRNYQNMPGRAGVASGLWPGRSPIVRPTDRPILIMAVHPHCPCTRASVGELALLMTRLQGQLSACVLFYKPKRFAANWEKTDLWQSAARIPGVTVRSDMDGVEARRFGAFTSGQTLVYDKSGRLLFSGGITDSRGHWGDNAGFQMIVSQITRGRRPPLHSPVFGCSLNTSEPEAAWKK
jgi:hypothetical protein